MQEKASVINVAKRIGLEEFETLCNVADIAILQDGYNIDNRLTFADGVHKYWSIVSLDELVEIFIYRLWANHK